MLTCLYHVHTQVPNTPAALPRALHALLAPLQNFRRILLGRGQLLQTLPKVPEGFLGVGIKILAVFLSVVYTRNKLVFANEIPY